MEIFVATIHVIVALFMILVVLIQGGNQGGIGAAFGGGNTQGVFGASGATSFLGKLTYGAALIFMFTSIALAIIQGKGGEVGLSDKLKSKNQAEQPAAVVPPGEDVSQPVNTDDKGKEEVNAGETGAEEGAGSVGSEEPELVPVPADEDAESEADAPSGGLEKDSAE